MISLGFFHQWRYRLDHQVCLMLVELVSRFVLQPVISRATTIAYVPDTQDTQKLHYVTSFLRDICTINIKQFTYQMRMIQISNNDALQLKITNQLKIIFFHLSYTLMHNQNTHRSNNSISRFLTPRKNTLKKNKTHLNPNININLTNSKSKTKFKESFDEQYQEPNISSRELRITDFDVIKQMGRGKFGYVYAAFEKRSGYVVAIKKMSKAQLKENDFQQQVKREIIIQASLHHKNVLRLFGYFWDLQSVYLILQYAPGGELFNTLQRNRRLPQDQVSVIIRQICHGLMYLHSNNIIHRDIKPENILISGENVKIADFGWSVQTYRRRQTLCGTLDYLAPQIVRGQTHNHAIDIWQVGILAYQLSVGRPPFQTGSSQQTHDRIINQEVQFPSYISYQLRQFIRKILHKNPNKRLQCSQILKEPFISKYSTYELQLQTNTNIPH